MSRILTEELDGEDQPHSPRSELDEPERGSSETESEHPETEVDPQVSNARPALIITNEPVLAEQIEFDNFFTKNHEGFMGDMLK